MHAAFLEIVGSVKAAERDGVLGLPVVVVSHLWQVLIDD